MANSKSEYCTLFEAFSEAQSAFIDLSTKGLGRCDQDLARDPDYTRFHRSGMTIARIGGASALRGAMKQLSRLHNESSAAAEAELSRLWAGMDSWIGANHSQIRGH